MKKVNPIPEGYHSVTPYLTIDGVSKAIEFYKKALGATEKFRMEGPDGRITHAEMKIGSSHVMMTDESPALKMKGPQSLGGSPVSFMVYVEDVDFVAKQALAAGMKETRPVADQFYGDRVGTFQDPFGYTWSIGTHKEDLTPEQTKERARKAYGH
jgi:PhnB protein